MGAADAVTVVKIESDELEVHAGETGRRSVGAGQRALADRLTAHLLHKAAPAFLFDGYVGTPILQKFQDTLVRLTNRDGPLDLSVGVHVSVDRSKQNGEDHSVARQMGRATARASERLISLHKRQPSDHDPLDFIEAYLIAPTVIKLRRTS